MEKNCETYDCAFQFVLGRPGPLLKPGTFLVAYSACGGMRWWPIRIRWPNSALVLTQSRFVCVELYNHISTPTRPFDQTYFTGSLA